MEWLRIGNKEVHLDNVEEITRVATSRQVQREMGPRMLMGYTIRYVSGREFTHYCVRIEEEDLIESAIAQMLHTQPMYNLAPRKEAKSKSKVLSRVGLVR